ncbi:MAG: hypothetical protein V1874_02130 [Spirochaetota bacterium]
MNFIKYISLIFVLFLNTCSSRTAIVTDVIPADTIDSRIIDKRCTFIVSSNFSIALQEIKKELIPDVLKNEIFINEENGNIPFRIPGLLFFKIVLENTGDFPIEIGEIKLRYDNIISEALTEDNIKLKYGSSEYSCINFKELFSQFKLVTDELCDNYIDFTTDISKHDLLIKPGEKILRFIAFNSLPVEVRKFNITIEIKSDIRKKTIDFKLIKFEYRKSGKYFTNPEQDIEDL